MSDAYPQCVDHELTTRFGGTPQRGSLAHGFTHHKSKLTLCTLFHQQEEEELLSLCCHEVEHSDIFVCILKASADRWVNHTLGSSLVDL